MKKLITIAAIILTAALALALPRHTVVLCPVDVYEAGNPSLSNKISVFFGKFADPNARHTTGTLLVDTNTTTTNLAWVFWTEHLQEYNQSVTAADGFALKTQIGASGGNVFFTDGLTASFASNSLVPVAVIGGVTNEP